MASISLPDDILELLLRRAKARGLSLAEYLRRRETETVVRPDAGLEARKAAVEQMLERLRLVGDRLPPGHVIDDSRESIYGDRGF